MCDNQLDVSSKFKKLYEEKQKLRAVAKEYYKNLLYNPHRPTNDGIPFDPALQRYSAMSAYHVENFKPKAKHFAGFLLYLSPIIITWVGLHYYRINQEEKLRGGLMKYADRDFKLC